MAMQPGCLVKLYSHEKVVVQNQFLEGVAALLEDGQAVTDDNGRLWKRIRKTL